MQRLINTGEIEDKPALGRLIGRLKGKCDSNRWVIEGKREKKKHKV